MKAATDPSGMRPRWEHFEHVADVGVRGYGQTVEEAFANVALAMTAVITNPDIVEPIDAVRVDCEGESKDALLYAWMNALVFEMATRHMLYSDFEIDIHDGRLHGFAKGEIVDRARHQPSAEIKGATYTQLAVRRRCDGGWVAQCVLDV